MEIVSGIITFLLIWWTVLFTVLPWGYRQHQGSVEEGIRGAPDKPFLAKKFLATTFLTAILWLILFMLIEMEIISFREMAADMAGKLNN